MPDVDPPDSLQAPQPKRLLEEGIDHIDAGNEGHFYSPLSVTEARGTTAHDSTLPQSSTPNLLLKILIFQKTPQKQQIKILEDRREFMFEYLTTEVHQQKYQPIEWRSPMKI